MPAPSPSKNPSVLGDFVFGWGPEASTFVRGLSGSGGFKLITAAEEPAQVVVRGAVQHGTHADGSRWVALADLVGGREEEGVRALAGGNPPQLDWRGRFAQVVWKPGERKIAALTDHFSTLSLYGLVRDTAALFATDLRVLSRAPQCKRTLDLEAVYNYFNFANFPAPRTIFREIRRIEPATRVRWDDGRIVEDRYSVPEYPEDLRGSDEQLAGELRERIVASVQAYRPDDATPWGCFLSGGTDSSSIVSILARQNKGKVRSFSIGFAEQGYDELGFARIAAQACGADGTFHSVSREEAQALVARVVEHYDQPFGGASAVPTMACADVAHDKGMQLLVAGDGGDEIFGGNERYAKDQVMEAWYSLPAPIRALGKRVGATVGGSSVHFLNRVENFFERASLPNPDRFYTDDSFASDHYEELLTPDFRRAVAQDASLDFMRSVYRLGRTGGPLHRVMRLDLNMAIAQNDLRKVDSATRQAGVSVRFPMLDPQLVNYTGRLPERLVVRGLNKRYLFKKAMAGILPVEIIKKKKQGFGLPIAVWLRSDQAFQAMVRETLFDKRATSRGWWQPAFLERLFTEHAQGAWDHADYLWRLLMLELWLRRHVDAS